MNLWPLRRGAVTAADQPPAPRELGATGTINFNGFLEEIEYLAKLVGSQGQRMYERMLRSDASVSEAVEHIVAPVRNATWDIEPASDDPEHLEHAAMVRAAYFDWPSQPFSEYLDTALDYLPFGYQVFETVFQVVERELSYDDPNRPDSKVTVPARQYLTWRRFAHRLNSTIYKWNMDDGELASVTQQVFDDGRYEEVPIPADLLVVYTNRKRGDDFTGKSLIRPAFKPWSMKEIVEKVAVASVERFGMGVPVAYLPEGKDNDSALVARMEAILKNLRSGQFSYAVLPFPKALGQSTGGQGGLVEILSPSGSPPDFTKLLDYLRGEIKGAVLARFAELGHGSTGARATGDVQSEVWRAAVHAAATYVCDVNDNAIRRLVDRNYQGVSAYPRLVVSDIETKNLEEFATANAKLVTSGAIVPDQAYRAFVRRSIDAPDEDESDADPAADPAVDENGDPVEPETQPDDPPPPPA